MTECNRCGNSIPDSGLESLKPTSCPHCGNALVRARPPGQAAWNLIRNFFFDVWQIITEPTAFFRRMPTTGGYTGPLAFALICHWLGTSISYLWKLSIAQTVLEFTTHLFQIAGEVMEVDSPGRGTQFIEFRDKIVQWLMGAGPVVADPFFTLFAILFTSVLIYVGARILTPSYSKENKSSYNAVTYESVVRIVCFGTTPAILAAIPIFGGFISSLCTLIVTVVGVREVYKVSTFRALIIALFPKLLFVGIIGMGLLAMVYTVVHFFISP